MAKCHLLNTGVSDKNDDEIDFYINPNSAQTNSTIKEAVTSMENEENIFSRKIKTITLDAFCTKHNIKDVDVVKIDIQGGEYAALKSSPQTMKKVKILLAEICFLMPNTMPLLMLLNENYQHYKPINEIIMGADLKFYK